MGLSTLEKRVGKDKIRVWEYRNGKPYNLCGIKCPKCQNVKSDEHTDSYWQIRKFGCCIGCWAAENIKSITIIG